MERLKQTVRVKLGARNRVTYGVLIVCPCNARHFITDKDATEPEVWACDCGRPVALVDDGGNIYPVGERLNKKGGDQPG